MTRLVRWGMAGLLFVSCSSRATTAESETFRVIHLHVLQPDGQPAFHRDVELRGLDRRALGPIPFLNEFAPATSDQTRKACEQGWLFTTDDHGDITARIGNFAGWKDESGRPGWGTYIFVVQPGPDDAGATSQRFWTYDSTDAKNLWWNGGEWGQPLPLPPEGFHLTMSLQNGFTLYGKLADDRDHRTPVPGVNISTWNDLHVDTHTGYGGEIFQHAAVSDANGEFKILHLFHARLYLTMDALWMTTEHDGWPTQPEHALDAPLDQGLRITCGVLVHPAFHYTGTVTDVQGQPVAAADVVAGISSEPKAETYGDTHHFERTKTDAQGHYDLAASSPWGTFLEAEDPTHGRVDLAWPGYDSPPIPPGKYDLIFPAIPNPAK